MPQVEDENILEVVDVLLIWVNHLFTASFTFTALLYMTPTETAFSLYSEATFSPALIDSCEKL
jgi:hypothetical protein